MVWGMRDGRYPDNQTRTREDVWMYGCMDVRMCARYAYVDGRVVMMMVVRVVYK